MSIIDRYNNTAALFREGPLASHNRHDISKHNTHYTDTNPVVLLALIYKHMPTTPANAKCCPNRTSSWPDDLPPSEGKRFSDPVIAMQERAVKRTAPTLSKSRRRENVANARTGTHIYIYICVQEQTDTHNRNYGDCELPDYLDVSTFHKLQW
jgi:hypothetical protein